MLLGLDSLVQSIRIPSARHNTAGKLIYDHDLIVLDDIVMVFGHQVISPQCQNDAVLDLQIFRICQVFQVEEFLYLLHTIGSQVYNLIFLVNNEIAGLFPLNAHDGIDLGQILHILAPGHLLSQDIAGLVDLGGLAGLSGNDQRCTGFIDQDGVHLIDDGKVEIPKHQLFLVDGHVITQVIKAKLIIRHISDVTVISSLALLGIHAVEHYAYGKAHKLIHLSHPLCVTLGQIIIDRDYMNAFAFQRIQVSRQRSHQGLTFTGLHLCDTALMQDDTADQLYLKGLHAHCSLGTLPYRCISLRQDTIQCFSLTQTFSEFLCLVTQLLVGECLHGRTKILDLLHQRTNSLYLALTVRAENLICNL